MTNSRSFRSLSNARKPTGHETQKPLKPTPLGSRGRSNRFYDLWTAWAEPALASILISVFVNTFLFILLYILYQTLQALRQRTDEEVQSYLGELFMSPAVGGVAAVIAAAITATVIYLQYRQNKQKDLLEAAKAREEIWWARFEWITERAFPAEKDSSERFPPGFAVRVLEHLANSASNILQEEACSSLISSSRPQLARMPAEGTTHESQPTKADSLEVPEHDQVGTEEPQPTPQLMSGAKRNVPRDASSMQTGSSGSNGGAARNQYVDALRSYADTREGTKSASPEVESLLLREDLLEALRWAGRPVDYDPSDTSSLRIGGPTGPVTLLALPRDPQAGVQQVTDWQKKKIPTLAISPRVNSFRYGERFREILWNKQMGSMVLMKEIDKFLLELQRDLDKASKSER